MKSPHVFLLLSCIQFTHFVRLAGATAEEIVAGVPDLSRVTQAHIEQTYRATEDVDVIPGPSPVEFTPVLRPFEVDGRQLDIPKAEDTKASRNCIDLMKKKIARNQEFKKPILKAWKYVTSPFRPWQKKPLTFEDNPGGFDRYLMAERAKFPALEDFYNQFTNLRDEKLGDDVQPTGIEQLRKDTKLIHVLENAFQTFASKPIDAISTDEAKAWFQTITALLKVGDQSARHPNQYTFKVQFWFLDLWTKFNDLDDKHSAELAALTLRYQGMLKRWEWLKRDDVRLPEKIARIPWASELLYYDRDIVFDFNQNFLKLQRQFAAIENLGKIFLDLKEKSDSTELKNLVKDLGSMAKKTNIETTAQQKTGIVVLLVEIGYGPSTTGSAFQNLKKTTEALARQVLDELAGVKTSGVHDNSEGNRASRSVDDFAGIKSSGSLDDFAGIEQNEAEVFEHSAQRIRHERQRYYNKQLKKQRKLEEEQ